MQDNHRGITITSLFGKLLEHLILAESGEDILADQHDLQCGFTANMSPLLATLCLTEMLVDATVELQAMNSAALDARKTFDIVNHYLLLLRIFGKVSMQMWRLMDSLMEECFDTV